MSSSFFLTRASNRLSLLLALFLALPSFANETEKYQQSIGEISKKIKAITDKLNVNKALVATEREKLLEIEQQINQLDKSMQLIDYELAKTHHESEALSLQMTSLERKQQGNRQALQALLLNRYKQGEPNYLKSLLNQENPYAVGRLNHYYRHFTDALNQRFAGLNTQAIEYANLRQEYINTLESLERQRSESKALALGHAKAKQQRANTIDKLDNRIANNTKAINTLKGDRDRLLSLLTQLRKQAEEMRRLDELHAKQEAERLAKLKQQNIEKNKSTKAATTKAPIRKLVKGGFLKQKGRLAYPVNGKLLREFGSRMPESGMRSQGSFFTTNGSVPVKTIFRGRVLFADFLKGFGLLIIIDHGDNHISLYGHNNRLLKKVGDVVDTKEVIAQSGVTGGLKSHGLYFEIRNNATPVDAAKWCL